MLLAAVFVQCRIFSRMAGLYTLRVPGALIHLVMTIKTPAMTRCLLEWGRGPNYASRTGVSGAEVRQRAEKGKINLRRERIFLQ